MRRLSVRSPAFLGSHGPPPVPPTFVQGVGNLATSGSVSRTISPATAGNILVAVVGISTLSGTPTVNTPAGFSPLAPAASLAKIAVRAFYKPAAGGESSVTGSGSGTSPYSAIYVMEFTPGSLSLTADDHNSATAGTVDTLQTGNFGPFLDSHDILVVAGGAAANSSSYTFGSIDSGFTTIAVPGGSNAFLIAGYLIAPSHSAVNPEVDFNTVLGNKVALGASIG